MNNLTDIEIIESVNKGNRNDFALIVDRYKDKGFSLLKRMLKNEQDAEEVLQDSFIKAYRSLNSFRGDAKFSTWFYRIVYNSALSFLAGKRRREEKLLTSIEDGREISYSGGSVLLSDEDDKDVILYDAYAGVEKENISQFIDGLIEKLPARYSAVVNMFYLDEMTIEEISKATGMTVVNVKVLLHRARTALRNIIVKCNFQEELL